MDEVIREVTRVLQAVAAGDLGQRVRVEPGDPALAALVRATNAMAEHIAAELRGLTSVTTAVARGELTTSLDVAAGGEIGALNAIVNGMLERLRQLAGEAHRVATEVGAQARARGESRGGDVAGVWKELTDNMSLAEKLALVARSKSELIASMSHELRTPLNSLLILAKLLSDNREANLTATQVEYARTIYGSGGDLLALINELLELAKVESGTLRVEPVDIEVDELAAALVATFRPVAEQRGLTFVVTRDAGAPPAIRSDPRRLQQILRNLVGNALKFTHRGGVDVRIGLAADGRVAFTVSDTGIGIPAASLGRIFEPFQQAAGTTSASYGGTGLGLSISRAIAELLGGELGVASTPGAGSTFTLLLPERIEARGEVAPAAPAPAPPPSPPAVTAPELAGRTLLVVDHDIRRVFALAALLEAHGARLRFAERAAAARAMLAVQPDVDAVLVAEAEELPELAGAPPPVVHATRDSALAELRRVLAAR